MPEKKIVQNGIGRGELNTIRDILMGQQISEYEDRFSVLEKSFDLLKTQMLKEIQDLKSAADSNQLKAQKEMAEKIAILENAFKKENEELNVKFDDSQKKLNEKIANRFIEFGKKLLEDL